MQKRMAFGVAALATLALGASTLAASTIVVTPTNTQGWSTADTRPGGSVNFVVDATAPAGIGALQLTTDATNAAKAQYLHVASTPLANVTELSYYTKQNSASFASGDPSYQLPVCLGGVSGTAVRTAFTTFVYEPYENGIVTAAVWESWDVDGGLFWSSRYVHERRLLVTAGAGGPPFYTLSQCKPLPERRRHGFRSQRRHL